MNSDTGIIYSAAEIKAREEYFAKKSIVSMNVPPTVAQMKRKPPRVGRNEPCPCGSGIKFKKCHFTG